MLCIKSIIFWYIMIAGLMCKKIPSASFIRGNVKSTNQNFGSGSSLASMFWDIDSVLKDQLSMFTATGLEPRLSATGLFIANAYSPNSLQSPSTTNNKSSSFMFTDSTSIFVFPMDKGDITIYLDLQNNSSKFLELYAIRGLYCDREMIENIYSMLTPNFYKNVIVPPHHHITVKFTFKPLPEMESTKGVLQLGLEYFRINDDGRMRSSNISSSIGTSSSLKAASAPFSKSKKTRKFKKSLLMRSAPFGKPVEFEEVVINGIDWQVLFVFFMLSGLMIGAIIGIYKWIVYKRKGGGSRKRSK